MGVHRVNPFIKIVVCFEEREDGGLRAWSDDVPGFVLSHADKEAVLGDIEPALETILSHRYGVRVMVAPLVEPTAFDITCESIAQQAPPPACREYASQLAAA
jgi:hypothetical protein